MVLSTSTLEALTESPGSHYLQPKNQPYKSYNHMYGELDVLLLLDCLVGQSWFCLKHYGPENMSPLTPIIEEKSEHRTFQTTHCIDVTSSHPTWAKQDTMKQHAWKLEKLWHSVQQTCAILLSSCWYLYLSVSDLSEPCLDSCCVSILISSHPCISLVDFTLI